MSDEMILVLGALILLGIFVISSNTLLSNNNQTVSENQYVLTGIAIGQSVIEEAKMKEFDMYAALNDSNKFCDVLGTEANETITQPDTFIAAKGRFMSDSIYTDIDDYNGYRRIVNTPNLGNYQVSVSVKYAMISNPNVDAYTKTNCKRMEVTVKNFPYIDSIRTKIKLVYAFTFY
jgi:hypothetical protein